MPQSSAQLNFPQGPNSGTTPRTLMRDGEIKIVPKPRHDSYAKLAERGDRDRVPRAKRYEMSAVTKYRIRGEKEWYQGVLKNMSISGVLMSAAFSLPLATVIEMRFPLPVQLAGDEPAAEVICRGSVVRSWQCDAPDDAAAMVAARITHSRFLRQTK
jgi:hypothetical protein